MEHVKVLISSEVHDAVGRDLFREVPGVDVIPYDPNAAELTAEQAAAEVLIPPYRAQFSGSCHQPPSNPRVTA
jgi:hypothetical protein